MEKALQASDCSPYLCFIGWTLVSAAYTLVTFVLSSTGTDIIVNYTTGCIAECFFMNRKVQGKRPHFLKHRLCKGWTMFAGDAEFFLRIQNNTYLQCGYFANFPFFEFCFDS